jgi:hypothetical protein
VSRRAGAGVPPWTLRSAPPLPCTA